MAELSRENVSVVLRNPSENEGESLALGDDQ
jgi:hypothetical protein